MSTTLLIGRIPAAMSRAFSHQGDGPIVTSSSTMIPACSVPMATSSSARIMPSERTPRSVAAPSTVPPGMTAPGRATATVCPPATFGAPQTIWATSPSPTATRQTLRRSASGCRSASSTRPTTKWSSAPTPWWWTASTFVPVIVRRSSSRRVGSPGSQYVRSHSSGTRISPGPSSRVWRQDWSSELLQEAQVVVVQRPHVGQAVLELGDALDAHPPGEALDLLGVVAVVVDIGVDIRVDFAGAEDLQPAFALAQVAARAVGQVAAPRAVRARDVDLDARLGEREEVRAQADVPVVAEDRPGEAQQRALEVGERDVLVDGQALHLVELRRVGGVAVAPVGAPGDDDVERRRGCLPRPDLPRRGG